MSHNIVQRSYRGGRDEIPKHCHCDFSVRSCGRVRIRPTVSCPDHLSARRYGGSFHCRTDWRCEIGKKVRRSYSVRDYSPAQHECGGLYKRSWLTRSSVGRTRVKASVRPGTKGTRRPHARGNRRRSGSTPVGKSLSPLAPCWSRLGVAISTPTPSTSVALLPRGALMTPRWQS